MISVVFVMISDMEGCWFSTGRGIVSRLLMEISSGWWLKNSLSSSSVDTERRFVMRFYAGKTEYFQYANSKREEKERQFWSWTHLTSIAGVACWGWDGVLWCGQFFHGRRNARWRENRGGGGFLLPHIPHGVERTFLLGHFGTREDSGSSQQQLMWTKHRHTCKQWLTGRLRSSGMCVSLSVNLCRQTYFSGSED